MLNNIRTPHLDSYKQHKRSIDNQLNNQLNNVIITSNTNTIANTNTNNNCQITNDKVAPMYPSNNTINVNENVTSLWECVFFEQFNVPALYFTPPPILSLYASGRLIRCVLDCGPGLSSVVPIVEGFAIPHGIQRIDIGEQEITNYFELLLRESGCSLNRTLEIVRKIEEKECELKIIGRGNSSGIGHSMSKKPKGLTDIGDDENINDSYYQLIDRDLNIMGGDSLSSTVNDTNIPKYKLSDGTELRIGSSRL